MSFEAQVKKNFHQFKKTTLQLHKEKEMVAFRKLFPVLAIVAFLLGTATTASAQATGAPLVCNTNAGVPPLVRAEGYTELVGDIVLVCTGGNPGQAFDGQFPTVLEHEHHQPFGRQQLLGSPADGRRAGHSASERRWRSPEACFDSVLPFAERSQPTRHGCYWS